MSDGLDVQRKRLRFRCWHRGTKELDLLIGRFADAHLASLDGDQLARLEALLEIPEPILNDWVMGRRAPDPAHDHDVMQMIRDFTSPPTPT